MGGEPTEHEALGRPVSRRRFLGGSGVLAGLLGVAGVASLQANEATAGPFENGATEERPKNLALAKLLAGLAVRSVDPCRLVFTGSSTTAGYLIPDADNRYVNRLVAALQKDYPSGSGSEVPVIYSTAASWGAISESPGVHAYNAAQPTTTASNYLNNRKIDRIAALNPRAVFHMVGANDFAASVPPAAYKSAMLLRINQLKAAISGPCVQILIQSYERWDNAYGYAWSEYGAALSELAVADTDNVAFIDLSPAYSVVGVPSIDPLGLIGADRTHQTEAGHAFMADLLRQALRLSV